MHAFMHTCKFYVAIGVLVLSLVFLTVGSRFPELSILLQTAVTIWFFGTGALYTFIVPLNAPVWTLFAVSLMTLAVGITLGIFFARKQKVGVAVHATLFGLFLGLLFAWAVEFILNVPDKKVTVITWTITLTTAFVIGALAAIFDSSALVFGTSFIGAFYFARGLSLFTEAFPSELTVLLLARNKQLSKVHFSFWLYAITILVITALSIWFQSKDASTKRALKDFRNKEKLK